MACTNGLPFRLQNTLHSILVDFVNGNGESRLGKVLYPLIDSFRTSIQRQLACLRDLLVEGQERGCGFPEGWKQISKLDLRSPIEPFSVAVILSSAYYDLYRCAVCYSPDLSCQEVLVGGCLPDVDPSARYRLIGLDNLLDYVPLKLSKYLSGFYLHGSMATLDFVPGYSDVDTLVIINQETLFTPERLMECRRALLKAAKFLYLVDPHQHHGYGVLTEVDLLLYPQPYFPIVLYAFSRPLLASGQLLAIRERDSLLERQQAFSKSVDFLIRICRNGKTLQGQYAWKLFLSTLVLLPSLFLQLKEQYVYKRDSFEQVRREFMHEWYVIERATVVRLQWRATSPLFVRRLLARCSSNPWLLPILYRRFCNQMPAWSMRLLGDSFLQDAGALAVSMRERAIDEGYLEDCIV